MVDQTGETQQPLKVALIGTGYFGRFHYAAWQRMPDVQLVGLLTQDSAEALEFQKVFGVEAIYRDEGELFDSDATLIDIVSPPHTHADFIHQCVQSQKAVVCQKPFCQSIDEAIATVQYIQNNDAFVVVHENFRFQPWYEQIKRLLDSNCLGDVYEISFNFRPGDGQGENAYLDRQPYFQTQPRFFIQETGIHFFDVFRYLIGDITGVFARLAKLNPVIAGEDSGMVIVEFENGVRGLLNGNRLSDHAANNTRLTMGEMRIEGSDGVLTLDGDGVIRIRKQGCSDAKAHDYQWQDIDFGADCVYRTNRHIADHLLNGLPIQNLAEDYLQNRLVEEAVYLSDKTGQWTVVRQRP